MATINNKINLQELYETDDHLWLEETIKMLKNKRLDELDLDNLIEELESLSRRDKATVYSFLELIIIHLLLLQYWESERSYNGNHWRYEIISFRDQLENLLTKNLSNYLEDNLPNIYQKAVKRVQIKTNNTLIIPSQCPYTLEELLDEDWYPKI